MAEKSYLEIESKILAPDLDAVRERLANDDQARKVRPRLHEYNIRYENAANALTLAGIVLRLRREEPLEDGDERPIRAVLTYKAPAAQVSDRARTRFEAEVEVDDFKTMDLILLRMGYHKSIVYEKYRTTYHLLGTEVVLDEMPFGSFVEIEGDDVANIEEATARLGLSEARHFPENYTTLFEYVKINLNLNLQDLTFADFEGINVPPEAFDSPGMGLD